MLVVVCAVNSIIRDTGSQSVWVSHILSHSLITVMLSV